jgi:hypothetical protein
MQPALRDSRANLPAYMAGGTVLERGPFGRALIESASGRRYPVRQRLRIHACVRVL